MCHGIGVTDPIIVPKERLSREALLALVEAYVLQEGTDYGEREYALADKRAQVLAQVEKGDVVVVFHPQSEECTLAPASEVRAS